MSSKYKRQDHHYKEAKAQGLRSRAYFKLEELDQKYKLIKKNQSVIDLGAWPGSWMEYTIKKIGPQGYLLGVDLVEIDPFPFNNIELIQGDLSSEDVLKKCIESNLAFKSKKYTTSDPNKEIVKEPDKAGKFDLVLSDMSPKFNGIKESDQARAAAVGELAFFAAEKLLKRHGNLIVKVFKAPDTDALYQNYRKCFDKLIRAHLKSTRKTSNEFYLIGLSYKGSSEEGSLSS